MSTVLTIGAVDLNDGTSTKLLGMKLGVMLRTADAYGGPTVDIARAGMTDTSSWVESRFFVLVTGTSVDNTAAILDSIATEVRDLSAITVSMDGSAYSCNLIPLIGSCTEVPLDNDLEKALINAFWTKVEIVIQREPYVYTPAVALVSDTGYNAPAVVDLTAETGQYPAPRDLLANAAALELSSFWAGAYPDPTATIADFIFPLGQAAWTGGEGWTDPLGYPAAPTELVLNGSPTGAAWPATWTRSSEAPHAVATYLHALGSEYHIEDDATPHNCAMSTTTAIVVTAGTDYVARCYLEVVSVDAGTITCAVDWYSDAAGTTLVSSTTIKALAAITADTLYEVSAAAPATAIRARLRGAWSGAAGGADERAIVHGWSFQETNVWRDNGAAYTDIDVTDFEPGEYLVLAKCSTPDDTDPGTIKHAYAEAVTIPSDTLQWLPLGMLTLPCSATRVAATSTLRITITGAGAGDEAYVNAVVLLPASFGGIVAWRSPITAGVVTDHAHLLRWEDDILYADDTGDIGNAFGGRVIRSLGGILVVVAEQVTPSPTTHVHLTISATPRWEQLPDG
jgi:hypothetical protein